MNGLWDWLDFTASALFNLRNPRLASEGTSRREPDKTFVVGMARPFGADAPQEGDTVSIPLEAFAKHGAVFGASGSGKSVMASRLRDALIKERVSLIDIDFRGDGTDLAINRLVAERIDPGRVTVMDLRDQRRIVPLNLLGYGPGDPHSRAAVVHTALREAADSWGVQLNADLRGCLVALAEAKGSVLDVGRILSPDGSALRESLLASTCDDYVREFLGGYAALSPEAMRNRSAPVVNKLDEYLSHPVLRASLGMNGAPNMREIMDRPGSVTLVALGADRNFHATLVGRMLIGAIQRAAMARVDTPEMNRNQCVLLVDEAQNVLGEESVQILAEGRRFRLGIVLCTQFCGFLPAVLRESVKVNCSTQTYFATSAAEALAISADVVCSLPRDEVRKTLLTAPVGAAILVRRGMPASFVTAFNSPSPRVDADEVSVFKRQVQERTSIPWTEAQAILAKRAADHAKPQREVVHVTRKPFSR